MQTKINIYGINSFIHRINNRTLQTNLWPIEIRKWISVFYKNRIYCGMIKIQWANNKLSDCKSLFVFLPNSQMEQKVLFNETTYVIVRMVIFATFGKDKFQLVILDTNQSLRLQLSIKIEVVGKALINKNMTFWTRVLLSQFNWIIFCPVGRRIAQITSKCLLA